MTACPDSPTDIAFLWSVTVNQVPIGEQNIRIHLSSFAADLAYASDKGRLLLAGSTSLADPQPSRNRPSALCYRIVGPEQVTQAVSCFGACRLESSPEDPNGQRKWVESQERFDQ